MKRKKVKPNRLIDWLFIWLIDWTEMVDGKPIEGAEAFCGMEKIGGRSRIKVGVIFFASSFGSPFYSSRYVWRAMIQIYKGEGLKEGGREEPRCGWRQFRQ